MDIHVKGARENNLKNIDVVIPRNALTVITGLSGSGKSTLAFDTLFAEGQRRFIEGLSTYSKNFLPMLKKPELDELTGMSPAIAIDQKTVALNPRSTVGTLTQILDYLRLLYARLGTPTCPDHGHHLENMDREQILEKLFERFEVGSSCEILSPVVKRQKGEFSKDFVRWSKQGFIKAKVDGKWKDLDTLTKLAKTKFHDIDLWVDELSLDKKFKNRFMKSLERAMKWSKGYVLICVNGKELMYSAESSCPECGYSVPKIEPAHLSFNDPRGACGNCRGLGSHDWEETEDEEYMSQGGMSYTQKRTRYRATQEHTDEDAELGIDKSAKLKCKECDGSRLNKRAESIYINGYNLGHLSGFSLENLYAFLSDLKFSELKQAAIFKPIYIQLKESLGLTKRLGVSYLSLDRPSQTLSGGETQRLRLASQMGSPLVGVTYVLDEPSIGLHPKDHLQVIDVLKELRDRGNTIIVVEHDERTMKEADCLIELGPRAGKFGGTLELQIKGLNLSEPERKALKFKEHKNKDSITLQYLKGEKSITVPEKVREATGLISLESIKCQNLDIPKLDLPLKSLVGITGVSGSGKSTLMLSVLAKSIYKGLKERDFSKVKSEELKSIDVSEKIRSLKIMDQKPIGKTSRSNPITYVGAWSDIRSLFGRLPESQIRGFTQSTFSFNTKGGRCEECHGHGRIKHQMSFLSDVYVKCHVCDGQRFSKEVLKIRYRNKNISDVLKMSFLEATEFFENHKLIYKKLSTVKKTGLGYLTLGQSTVSLSGGEAQRIKLSKELSKSVKGNTIYLLDEPTTGLHWEDVGNLLKLLQNLVDMGHTVIVVEHHTDVLKNCDYLIELGPGGGENGGRVLFSGSRTKIKKEKKSLIKKYL